MRMRQHLRRNLVIDPTVVGVKRDRDGARRARGDACTAGIGLTKVRGRDYTRDLHRPRAGVLQRDVFRRAGGALELRREGKAGWGNGRYRLGSQASEHHRLLRARIAGVIIHGQQPICRTGDGRRKGYRDGAV